MIYASIAAIFLSFWFSAVDTTQAEALVNAGHMKRARALLEPLQRSNPKEARVLYLLSEVKEGFGDLDGALQLAEQVLVIDSQNADYHSWVAVVCGELAEKANIFRQAALARRTKKEAETAISLNPKHVDARSVLVNFYMEAPTIVGGDRQKARETAAELARIDPAEGASARAVIALAENDKTALEAAYNDEAKVGPQSYDAQMEGARYFASDPVGKYDLAEKYARAALKIDPGRGGAYAVLATVLARAGRVAELDGLLVQAEKNDSDDFEGYYQAAHAFLATGKELPRAESYLRKYLTQEPEAGTPDLATAHWQLGLVLEKLGRKPEAITEVGKAVQMRPNFDDAKKDLKRMKP